mgnify:FL=1
MNFNKNINLKDIVIGYKITDREYIGFNIILTLIGFAIYKSYYVSDQRNKSTNVFNLFKVELDEYLRSYNLQEYTTVQVLQTLISPK